jgi:hypothetical protein
MFTHKVGQTYTDPSGTVKSTVSTYTADFELGVDDTVDATTTNKEFDIALTKANIVSMVITCDKAVTVKTNSSSSAQDTIPLAAGQAIIWASDHTETCPFSNNVTKFYVTNAGSAAAHFQFSALLNQGV